MNDRTILVDCDGVLLSWDAGFRNWIKELNYTEVNRGAYNLAVRYGVDEDEMYRLASEFNCSEHFSRLDVFRDAQMYVRDLRNKGFRFVCVTSASDSPVTHQHRMNNLELHFGDAVEELYCLPILSCKKQVLEKWKNSGLLWVEDHPGNALAGQSLGLSSILIDEDYNRHVTTVPRVSNSSPWKEIHSIVLKKYLLD